MNKVLHFIASTNVKNLIGKDLVTDQITAVFELVKNSYDADSETVRLEISGLTTGNPTLLISDNGTGMDLYDIQNKWMVIGTESKKNKEYSDIYKRPLNGDKGIGRFSVDRLGRELILQAAKAQQNDEIVMKFDWVRFENEFNDLNSIEIPYETRDKCKNQGVSLTISGLRDIWDKKNIDKLVRSLRQFKSPFNINDNFSIILHVPEYNIYEKEIRPYNLGDISSLWIDAEIPIEDCSIIKLSINKDGIIYNEEYKNPYSFGPVKCILYFFNTSDKLRFFNRMNITVKDFGNVRLYRDDFRIYPYGDSLNDWLDLDMRLAQKHLGRFGSRDLIGYVQISKKYNKGIDAPTNRQGIIDNNYAKELREFITSYPVKVLEKYFFAFKKSKNETIQETKKEVSNAVDDLKKVAKDIQSSSPQASKLIKQLSEVVAKGQNEQTKFIKDQEELIKVYQRVASKEVLLHKIVHEALINLDAAKSVSKSLNDWISENQNNFNNDFYRTINRKTLGIQLAVDNAWSILLRARDNVIQKKDKKNINIKNFCELIINDFKDKLEKNNIKIELTCNENISYYIDNKDLRTIFENFISNSVKALIKTDDRPRRIWIKVVSGERFLVLNFKDNGIGIPEHLRNRIFDPFFSTTDSFGMGLSIVDEIVKEYNGELNLVENNESGAEFQLKVRR